MPHPLFRYETHRDRVPPFHVFAIRMARNFAAATSLIVVSLVIGVVGYHHYEELPWLDAFANASMILSGMGPLGELKTSSGKLFAGCYALYSGLIVIFVAGILLAPVVHRALHKFHAADEEE